jgi:hypothetical protein
MASARMLALEYHAVACTTGPWFTGARCNPGSRRGEDRSAFPDRAQPSAYECLLPQLAPLLDATALAGVFAWVNVRRCFIGVAA